MNFIAADVGVGSHEIKVQAKMIDLNASRMQGSAVARGLIGKGSVTIEEVRMIKGEDIEL